MYKPIVFLAALFLSACGFHLKGTQPYDRLPVVQWNIEGGALQQPLESALIQASGEYAAQSPNRLKVLSFSEDKDVYTVTRAAKLNEYLLTLDVTAQAYRNGSVWGAPMNIRVRRVLPYADSLVLGKQEEAELIRREMRKDAAGRIVRRLQFLPLVEGK